VGRKCLRCGNRSALQSRVRNAGDSRRRAHVRRASHPEHPTGARVKEAGIAVWFFPPTDRFLVELSFTGFVKTGRHRQHVYGAGARMKAAGLLRVDQSSKTEPVLRRLPGTPELNGNR